MSDVRIAGSPVVSGASFKATPVRGAVVAPGAGDVSTISSAARTRAASSTSWSVAGGVAAALALSIGVGIVSPTIAAAATVTPPAQVQIVETQVQSKGTLSGGSETQALQTMQNSTGLKTDQLFGLWTPKTTPSDAATALSKGKKVDTSSPIQGVSGDTISSTDQLAELAAVREMPIQTGISPAVGHAFHALENSQFSLHQGDKRIDGFQALDAINHGQSVTVTRGSQTFSISSAQEAVELNALDGDGQNSPLPADTTALLKKMAEQTSGEGFASNGRSLTAFETLRAVRTGQPVSYHMTGGAFGDTLSRSLTNLNQLTDLQQRAQNQHDKDQYRPSIGEYQQKMGDLTGKLPGLAKDNLTYIQGQISTANSESQAAQGAIAANTQKMQSANDDLRSTSTALLFYAGVGPTTTTVDGHGNVEVEPNPLYIVKVGLLAKVTSDQSQIGEASAAIGQAQMQMSVAQQKAMQAQMQMGPAVQIQANVPAYQKLVAGVNSDDTFATAQPNIQQTLTSLGSGAVAPSLQDNLQRQGHLMNSMQKPAPPAGWQAASDLFE